jgi:general secretion pathway protein C
MNGRPKNWLKGEALFFLFELALAVALAATLAHWTWALFAPKAVGASLHVVPASAGGDGAIKRNLFGASHEALIESTSKLRLVGVASPASPRAGRAVFVLDNGKSTTARSGDSIAPGTVLREVHPDHVLLERGGATERLTLERKNAGR